MGLTVVVFLKSETNKNINMIMMAMSGLSSRNKLINTYSVYDVWVAYVSGRQIKPDIYGHDDIRLSLY